MTVKHFSVAEYIFLFIINILSKDLLFLIEIIKNIYFTQKNESIIKAHFFVHLLSTF